MDVFECMRTRRSVRRFLTKPVDQDRIGKIMTAGSFAPSAGNLQARKFIFIQNEVTRKAIAEACFQQYWIADAPVHIVVCAELNKNKQQYGERGEKQYSYQDCAAAVQNMLLEAHTLGLGSCWVGAFDDEMIRRACGIPDNVKPVAVLPIGYPGEKPAQHHKYNVLDVSFIEKWGAKLRHVPVALNEYSGYIENHIVKPPIKKLKEKTEKVLDKIRKKTNAFE